MTTHRDITVDGVEIPCLIDFDYDAGEPGCTSGPADNWHPDSPASVCIMSIVEELTGRNVYRELTQDQIEKLEQDILEEVEGEIDDMNDSYEESREEYNEEARDYERSQRY